MSTCPRRNRPALNWRHLSHSNLLIAHALKFCISRRSDESKKTSRLSPMHHAPYLVKLLRAHREWPRCRRAADEQYELASPHIRSQAHSQHCIGSNEYFDRAQTGIKPLPQCTANVAVSRCPLSLACYDNSSPSRDGCGYHLEILKTGRVFKLPRGRSTARIAACRRKSARTTPGGLAVIWLLGASVLPRKRHFRCG